MYSVLIGSLKYRLLEPISIPANHGRDDVDWADSSELIEIFQAEIDERSARLVQGGRELGEGTGTAESVNQMILDAHTIKGSSNMIGRTDLARAAAALEKAWRAVRDRETSQAPELGKVLSAIAKAMGQAAGSVDVLIPFESTVQQLDDWARSAEIEIRPATAEAGERLPFEVAPDDASLGGLLSSVEEYLSGAVTRVDTNDLYRLINRTVELEIEADSIADLSYVTIEAFDPAKLMSAWRSQLARFAADVADLRRSAVSLTNVRFGEAVETFSQFLKFLGRRLSKNVELVIRGSDVMVDRQIVDMLREPLRHLIVNAVDHGIEPSDAREAAGKAPIGRIDVEARLSDGRLLVTVTDDGGGVNWEAVAARARAETLGTSTSELDSHLFRSGFTTIAVPNDFSGTGDGLSAVADAADRVGGNVSVSSQPGVGTSIRLDLPSSMVLQRVVVIGAGDQFFGLVESAVLDQVDLSGGRELRELAWRREALPLVSFCEVMGLPPEPEPDGLVLSSRSGRFALAVPEQIDRRPVAVKGLGPILDDASHVVGAALLGAGEVLVVVDHHFLGSQARISEEYHGVRPRVLVVDDSAGVRQLIAVTLRGKGFDVVAVSGAHDAVLEMPGGGFDVLVVDYAMPRSNGVELVKALRDNGVRIPIVMVSGVADAVDKAAAWEVGVDAYLDKYDLRSGALVATINRLLATKAGARG